MSTVVLTVNINLEQGETAANREGKQKVKKLPKGQDAYQKSIKLFNRHTQPELHSTMVDLCQDEIKSRLQFCYTFILQRNIGRLSSLIHIQARVQLLQRAFKRMTFSSWSNTCMACRFVVGTVECSASWRSKSWCGKTIQLMRKHPN